MKYIIIEDEKIAADRLKRLVMDCRPDYNCLIVFDSIEGVVSALPSMQFDLVFMDIQLADGLSFDIFDQIKLEKPIIFTTAYDSYAIKAFKTNSVDYLLKPIDPHELVSAIEKFEKNSHQTMSNIELLSKSFGTQGKERFIIKVGEHLRSVKTEDVLLIYSKDKATYIFTREGRRFPIDYTMDKVEELMDSSIFFRVSRKFLVQLDAIDDIIAYTNSRLELKVSNFQDEQIIVARERVGEFKSWLDR